MRVLVCGGRGFDDVARVFWALDELGPVSALIHGCARGADTLAARWAVSRGVEEHRFPANWSRDGKAAGPIRNAQMLREGKPDLVVAFPGGRGTADMVAKAKAAGVHVIEVPA
jgi:hypothetical protein